ncbi:sacsin-like isoform X2 [Papaver somniferum]|uniref:sacsin-like isoform X2 n=1 Tax=Papaver somniferum TaxID=3469 RepID=UPI000E705F9A|nr:sacsin-like isoform X2 [Papaver somniferum]
MESLLGETPSSSILLEDFGQKVDLTRRIREVLINYPEGTTVLKELIQNADDAGATKVCLCLDRRVHRVDSLLSPKLAEWQGSALLAFNNAEFTEDDFVSISRIGDSKKQQQAWKTGRFGVGFNSVYHLTDLPSFVSGKYAVLFDPQGVYLPNVSAVNPGKRIDYVSSSAISLYEDQFFPYCAFGCDMKKHFPGTLFRFPLRNADQAASSKLSRQAYSEDDISSMFVQLYEEGVFTLLFLKSVLSVEMYVWEDGVPEPRKLYSCAVRSQNDDTIWHRQALLRISNSLDPAKNEMDSYTVDFLSEAIAGSNVEKRIHTFFIVQTMASTSSRIGTFATSAAKEYDVHLLPWASVAACISDSLSEADFLKHGRAFCFLPLPVRTGLSVQVNGYFEVSSNRRSIWYGADMDRGGKLRSDWNRLLLEGVVAPAYKNLLLGARDLLGSTKFYYSLWPSGSFEEPWKLLVEEVYKIIGNSPVLYSDLDGGKWVSPTEAFLHDEEFTKSKELGEALLLLGMPIVHLPNPLIDILLRYSSGFRQRVVTPETVRHFIKASGTLISSSRLTKLVLLDYCLQDLIDADVVRHTSGLPLLPLASGEFGSFSESSHRISYFICNELEYMLLQKIPDRLIDQNIPSHILSRLSAIAKCSNANICFFNIHFLLQLLPQFVPADWQYKSRVRWEPESCSNHPAASWFVSFWQYLREKCDNLSIFGDWPILPSTSGHLYRASRQSKLIDAAKLSDTIGALLVKIGCKILNPDYGVQHQELSLYVYDANGAGVLDAIFDVISTEQSLLQPSFENVGDNEKNELCLFLLDRKWYVRDSITDSHIVNCKRLPIFKVYGGRSSEADQFSDLVNPQKYLPPKDVPSYLLGGEFIQSSCDIEDEILLRHYGVARMGKTDFYKTKVLNRINELLPEVRDSTMLSVLRDLPQLCVEDASFREILRKLEFIPTLSGALKCPHLLYDPRNEELYSLLEDSDSFPVGVFEESVILDMLQGLGLRTSVSPETVIESARQIELFRDTDQRKANARGKVLLSYLEVHASKWLLNPQSDAQRMMNRTLSRAAMVFKSRNSEPDLNKFWNDLKMICWCPVLVSSPYQSLPWPSASSMVAPPKLVRLRSDLWLVSASMRILDGECSSTTLACSLGWSSPPGGSVIAAQLLELGKNNELVTDQVLRQELALAMPRIYSILSAMIGSDDMEIVKAILEGCRWIWVGDGFAISDEVVLNGPLHLAPYIRVIPVDLAVFKALFLELGIREFLKPTDYANILFRMATRRGSTPLNSDEVRAALLVVQHLAEVQFQDQQVQVYLPDISSQLYPATSLVYNDAPWLLSSENAESGYTNASSVGLSTNRDVHKFVHGNISNDVAEKLGVCSLRRLLLAESADSMNLSLSGAAEAFGQHEALTTRLKHIVEMYADGPGILFELVQNAEDAGASEVAFLLDKTQYGTSSVLSPEMGEWQGPALYCFNSSIFSAKDLYAISRIGQDSKLEKPFAIGRFGLGFNCVYHFTDIPGFVSGENIVMFDPHASHLPGISPSHPGLRIKFAGRRILEQFPDQFSPFLHFGCDLQQPFPGTLFRFPLRSENAASRSLIKREKYAPEDVLSLFSSFSEVVSETLLFLRNVRTISIFVKEGAGHDMQLLHRVERNHITGPEVDSHPQHSLLGFIHGKHNGLDRNQFLNKLSKTPESDLPWNIQKIVVTERDTSGDKSHFWVMSECLGGGNAKKVTPLGNNSHNFIPWACVAAYLHTVNLSGIKELNDSSNVGTEDGTIQDGSLQVSQDLSQYRRNFDGRAFCFLPLPINTGLPIHVNAYFELSSNRRDIWFGNDMAGGGKVRSDWNKYLLEDVVAPAYGRLLEKVGLEMGLCDLFSSLWPVASMVEPWASMVRKLYMSVCDLGLRVLHTEARGGQWISTKQAIFPDFSFSKAEELLEALSDAGLPLVRVSKTVVDKFKEAYPSLHFLTPQLLRTLLTRRKRGFKNRSAMILTLEYCLYDINVPVQSDTLLGFPLVPLANGLFTTFSRKGEGERIFVTTCENEYGLLRDLVPHLLVDSSISEGAQKKLCDIGRNGDSNISLLSCKSLEELFPRIMPPEWQNSKQVSWTPGHQGQPSIEWMRLLWSYFTSSCDVLSMFSKWPILPVGNNCLLQLVRNSNVIEEDGWSENMSSLLQKLGCFFLRSDFPIDHPQLKDFVQGPTASGVLNALLAVSGESHDIGRLFSDASEGELHELRSFILQTKWFSGCQMNQKHIYLLKQLPMFESYKSRKLVALSNPTKWIKPEGVHEELLTEAFVRMESEKDKTILESYLEVREPARAEFYKDYVLNRMSEFVTQPVALSAILHDVKLLIREDPSIRTVLLQTPFVLAANGSWQHPSRLYDPRVPELQKVLHKEAFFPSDKFLDTETLETLIDLGLNTTLGLGGLLDSARSVSMLYDSGDLEAFNWGRRLLSCLDMMGCYRSREEEGECDCDRVSNSAFFDVNNVHDDVVENDYLTIASKKNCCRQDLEVQLGAIIHEIPDENFWSEMKIISWCPVYVDPPQKGLPWFRSKHQIAAPVDVRPKSQMWLMSSMMRILDGECCSKYLMQKLGWLDRPNVGVLSTQLVELSNSYSQLKLLGVHEPELDAVLQIQMPKLYSKLQEFVGTDDFTILKSAVNGVTCVWIGDNFISPEALAYDSPVKFHPYLYAVPSELSEFRELLSALGVRSTFDAVDYVNVLQRLQRDLKGLPLSSEQLSFVHCVLEAVADCYADKPLLETSSSPLLLPDSFGVLMSAMDLVYNDAPWMENNSNLASKHFLHPSISNDLASRLGVQSLRCLSLVDEEMIKDLPCMDYPRISGLLSLYGNNDFLLFDLLELADCCKARKLHLIFDKREHSRQSLLQHNLGEFQGPAVVAVLDGATLNQEEVSSLQLLPPWRLRGNTLNYGLGLLSCYFICDLPAVVSSGHFYMFDPHGKALTAPSSNGPSAKMFSLRGTGLTERFRDQFNPMLIDQNMPWSSSDSTIIRMPLSSDCMKDGLEDGSKRVKQIFDRFVAQASTSLLFLKSVFQVTLSTWEEGSLQPVQDYSVCIDPMLATVRNPFSEKKWRKFQISRLFSSSNASIKVHTIDVHLLEGETKVVDKWIVVLSLGSGQTRNMALDRRYLAYNLTPVAGVAAHISRNGRPADAHSSSCILSPLPLSKDLNISVTALGCFLVRHNGGRYLFKYQTDKASLGPQLDAGNQLIEAWNRELMSCVRDSYVEMVLEMQRLRREPSNSTLDPGAVRAVSSVMQAYGDRIYAFWPRSRQSSCPSNQSAVFSSNPNSLDVVETDWECLIKQVIRPFYTRLVDLPVWQLYSGQLVKAEEGMFLAQHGNEMGDNSPPSSVFSYIKEHYPVFSVPWELVSEIQAVGVTVREIRPKMVRSLLKASSTSFSLPSVETYIDVLEYCLSDIELNLDASSGQDTQNSHTRMAVLEGNSSTTISNSSLQGSSRVSTQSVENPGGDPLEIVTTFGRALFDFGRGVVEDIGRAGGPLVQRNTISGSGSSRNPDPRYAPIAAEIKGLLCPTATSNFAKLGIVELWVASKEQQTLMLPLQAKFIHPECLRRSVISEIFLNENIQMFLKLQSFSHRLLANNMKSLFVENWVNHVMNSSKAPWFSWESGTNSDGAGGPSPEWIRLFWKSFNGSSPDLSLFSDWPLIPAFLGRPVLCRARENHLIFIPPLVTDPTSVNDVSAPYTGGTDEAGLTGDDTSGTRLIQSYISAFELTNSRFPWLSSLLNQFNIPVYDTPFLECAPPCNCFPSPGHSLGKVVVTKLLASKRSEYFVEPAFSVATDRDNLFNLFAVDSASSSGSTYTREEIDLLRALPIYRTVLGSYTRLHDQGQCIITPSSFFKPSDDRCLCSSTDSSRSLFHALGVPELHDQEVLVKFALPGFEEKAQEEQEDILIYLYTNWQDLELDSNVVSVLKETKFVRNASGTREELFKPQNLLDPSDSLLMSVFAKDRNRFPGERFTSDGWLRILRKTGLRTSTEADVILECARKVEHLGDNCMRALEEPDNFEPDLSSSKNEISVEIWSLAVSVVQNIFLNFAVLYNNNFCKQLSQIAFIPSERGFPSIGGKKGGKRVLCSYNEAILLKDWPLGWSSAPILAGQNVVPPEYAWGALHLRSPPAFTTVLRHLEIVGKNGGEDTLAHWPTVAGMMTVEEASLEILRYLDKIWSSLSASEILALKELAFVPVANGTRLVTANCLFARLAINLSPFAFELPSLYLPFMKVLKDLGIQEAFSLTCARDLLLNIQKACGYQRLNPNELRAVMEILQFVCDAIVRAEKGDESSYISEAVVPDDGCRLVVARSCVYIDSFGSRFIRSIDISRIRFVHPDLPERICTGLGIQRLSDVVVEELDETQELEFLDQIGSVSLTTIKEKLSSRSFQSAVWKIVNSTAGFTPASEALDLEQIQRLLESVAEKLQFVRFLYTRYMLVPRSLDVTRVNKEFIIPQWEDGLRHRSFNYVDQSKTRALVAEPPYYISVFDVIAIVVSQVIGLVNPLPIGSLFSTPVGSEQAIVDALKLGSDRRENELGDKSSQLVGRDLVPQDARQVQFHPLRPFYSGEVVAWRTGKDGDKLKYGRVPEDVRPSAGQALYRFKVETAPGETQLLLSSHIFSFKSIPMANEVSSSTLLDDHKMENENLNRAEVHGAGTSNTSSSKPATDHNYGRVSPAELVQAVNEMLSAAGINMNAEKQSLLQTALTLQEQLKESQAALLLEQEKADSAAKEAETAKSAWMCRVCLSTEVDITIVPCGHVLCRRCSSAVSRCPFCRLQVSKTLKIFRP